MDEESIGLIPKVAVADMEKESIGFKARLVSMLLRLLTLGLIAVALMIST